jgi:hypothetical protein
LLLAGGDGEVESMQEQLPTFQILVLFMEIVQANSSSDNSAVDQIPVGWPYMLNIERFSDIQCSFCNHCKTKELKERGTS